MSEVVTTERDSAFTYDLPDIPVQTSSYQTIVKYNDSYYWIVTTQEPKKMGYRKYGGLNGFNGTWTYQETSAGWQRINDVDNPFHRVIDGLNYLVYDQGKIVAQSWNVQDLKSTYYPKSSFTSHNIPAPVGNVFDSLYTNDVLSDVVSVLPLIFAFFCSYIAIRKGIAFVTSKLKGV